MDFSPDEPAVLLWMPVGMKACVTDFETGPGAIFQSYPPEVCAQLDLALIKSVIDAGRGKEAWVRVRREVLSPDRVAKALEQYKAALNIDV